MDCSQRVGNISAAEDPTRLQGQVPLLVRSGSSPALDNREELELHIGRAFPTQSPTTLAEPSSPWPVHARSISPVSLQSSNGSGYLTPPLEVFHDSAPYKPAEDDRVSLNMRNGRKRKRKANYWRSNRSVTEQTSEPVLSPSEEVRDNKTRYFAGKDSHGKRDEVGPQMLLPPSEHARRNHRLYRRSSNLSASPPHTAFVEHGSWLSKHDTTNVLPGGRPELAKQITSDRRKRICNNLARISEALAANKHRRWSSLEPGALPVPTYSTAISIRGYKRKSEHDHPTGQCTASSKQADISAHPKQSLRVGYPVHQRPSVKSRRQHLRHAETPATITLRRASGITVFEEATRAAEAASCQVDIVRPASEQGLKRKMTRMMRHLPSYSVIAETAITYADVHVAPPIVARTLSGEGLESSVSRLGRTSAVQIRARSSIHEVIWKDECSSSSPSSAGQTSPRLSLQLTRRQSDPSEGWCCNNPSLDIECDPKTRFGSIRSRSCPMSSFIEDESPVKAQTRIVRPPHVSQKLSEWTWNHESKLDNKNHGALLCFESRRTGPAMQDEGEPAVVPLSELQGFAPEELPEEPCLKPSPTPSNTKSTFDSRNRLRHASGTRQVGYTTTDQSTVVLVSPTEIEPTPARTARRPPLSGLPESERRNSVKEP